MSKKKSILFIISALVLGIAIGVGATVLFSNSGGNSNTGTIVVDGQDYLLDEEGNIVEYDDAAQEGIKYRVCTFGRRGDEIENERHWYGPYSTVKEALYDVRRRPLGLGLNEIYVYSIKADSIDDATNLTFIGKTYYYVSAEY